MGFSCIIEIHLVDLVEIVKDFFFMHPLLSSFRSIVGSCFKKISGSWIGRSWIQIEIPMDELILGSWKDDPLSIWYYLCMKHMKKQNTKQTISSLQRRENEDSIFESTVEIIAKLKLKPSKGKEEIVSILIPAKVVVNSWKIIKNRETYAKQKSTAADVLKKLKHENMKFQQENLALKNLIITNGLTLPSELD